MKNQSEISEKKMGGEGGGGVGGFNSGNKELGEELATISRVRGLIYKVRGREVMLDADLAKIYGYETRYLNLQVARNFQKFEGEDFMFQLSKDEYIDLMCKNCTSSLENDSIDLMLQNATSSCDYIGANKNLKCQNGTSSLEDETNLKSQNVTLSDNAIGNEVSLKSKNLTSSWGGVRKLPYAFTEQGVYMLMTVLRGELAVKQSRALVMAFKAMKDYILENRALAMEREDLKMMALVAENSQQVGKIEKRISAMDERLVDIEVKVENAVMRNEVSPVMLDFDKFTESREYLFMNNELMEAKEVYLKIYGEAKKSVYIIDDYVDIRTLRLLGMVGDGVKAVIFSDNKGHHLHRDDLADFRREFPRVVINFVRTCDAIHDRFIIVDFGEKNETIYHCGASSKDAGRAVTMITKVEGRIAVESMHMVVEMLIKNLELKLR